MATSTEEQDRFPGARAVIYARISRDDEGDELGVARQVAACEDFVARRGWTTVAVLQDNSKSAFNPKAKAKRTGYLQMIELVKAGQADTIVCWEIDRIFRRNVDLEEVIRLVEENPVFLAPIRGSTYDLTTPHGRTVARLLTTLATQESDVKRERIRAAKAQHAQLGRVLGGGVRPYGYDDDRVTIREDEAKWIRYAVEAVIGGSTLYSITRHLNAEGSRTSTGKHWQSARLRSVLLGPRIAGKVVHQGSIVADAVWPPIIDFETWSRVAAILTNPQRRTNGGFTKPKLLSGIARCGNCDHVLRSQPKKGAQGTEPSYTCRRDLTGGMNGCGKIRIKGEWLDRFVETVVVTALSQSGVLSAAIEMDSGEDKLVERALEELAAWEVESEYVLTLLARQVMTEAEYSVQKKRLRLEKQAIEDRLASLSARKPLLEIANAGDVQVHWDALDTDQRRTVIASLLDRVVVGPARKGYNKPDPTRITFEWRRSVGVVVDEPVV